MLVTLLGIMTLVRLSQKKRTRPDAGDVAGNGDARQVGVIDSESPLSPMPVTVRSLILDGMVTAMLVQAYSVMVMVFVLSGFMV